MNNRTKFGLIGKNISYSFSRGYFQEKFKELKLDKFPSLSKKIKFKHMDMI